MTVLLMHILQEETGFPVTSILLSHLSKEIEKEEDTKRVSNILEKPEACAKKLLGLRQDMGDWEENSMNR